MKTFKLNKGVHLHVIKSEKFKDVSIYFNYYQKATSENRIARTYLSHLIGDKTDKYPTKALLLKQLDNLYGASHNVSHNIYGGASILQVSLRVLNDVYSEKGVLLKSFGLLKEMIEHSIINTESFEEARRNLIDSSNRKLEKPATFATSQANAIYGKGSYLALNSILQPEEIIEANIEEVISQHQIGRAHV